MTEIGLKHIMLKNSDKQALEEQRAEKTSTLIHQGRLIRVIHQSYQIEGRRVEADLVEHPGAVGILPVDPEGNILLIKQWRRAAGKILIEIPAGTLEPSESTLDCAQRELQEETGFKAGQMIPLGVLHTCPGFCTEKLFLFLGLNLTHSPLPPDDNEAIDLMPVSLEEALSLMDQGMITDAKTIATLYFYLRWREKTKDTL